MAGRVQRGRALGRDYMLTKGAVRVGGRAVRDSVDRTSRLLPPVSADSIEGLPPTTVVWGSTTPLRDGARHYVARLRQAGAPARVIDSRRLIPSRDGVPRGRRRGACGGRMHRGRAFYALGRLRLRRTNRRVPFTTAGRSGRRSPKLASSSTSRERELVSQQSDDCRRRLIVSCVAGRGLSSIGRSSRAAPRRSFGVSVMDRRARSCF